jgi:hypothetical protein
MHQLPKALLAAIIISSLVACGGSSSSSSRPSTPTTPSPQCSDGLDNDQDTLIDSADPGCSNDQDNDETDPPLDPRLSRYQMSNACWVVKAAGNGKYLVADGSNYSATATDSASAEGFYLKPTALAAICSITAVGS